MMIELTAAGGVLYRERDVGGLVLLIKRNGVWDLPKGKQEHGETTEQCARREVAEEVGIALPEVTSFLTQTYHEYERGGERYGKTTFWYKMLHGKKEAIFTPQAEEGITRVEWMPLAEAKEKVGYKNLKKVLQAFQKSNP